MIRLIIASDNRLYREALARLLADKGFIRVICTTQDAELTILETCHNKPDVVLVDMTMSDSRKVIAQIIPSCPDTKVVALAMTEDGDNILACAKRGVAGYLTRCASFEQLITALSSVVSGELYCPKRISEILFHKINSLHISSDGCKDRENSLASKPGVLLTQRENEIASLLTCGKSNKEIARELTIEVSTVKNHVHNILTKVGVRSRIQAVTILQQQLSSD